MVRVENIPEKLRAHPQWICWKSRPKKNGKTDKIPFDPRIGSNIDHLDSSNQLSFDDCLNVYSQYHNQVSGIGFVFTKEDPFSGVDLDDCLNGEVLLAPQQAIVQRLNSFSEISPSGRGVKVFVEGKLPGPNKNIPLIEMYSNQRFFTVTGNILDGNSALVQPRQKELELLYYEYFPDEHPRFGELFSSCYLMKFLLEKSRSGANLSHAVRRALASFSIALDDLDTEEMPFITLILSGCLDFDPEITRKQLESLKNSLPYGCEKLKEIVRDHFSDFDVLKCNCQLPVKDGRKPSPIRFVAPVLVEVVEWEDEDPEDDSRLVLPSFPLDVFPAKYAEAIHEIAESHTVPVEIPAIAFLTFAGACIGKTRAIQIKKGYTQHPNLFAAIIKPSGIGQTSVVETVKNPIIDVERRWIAEYQEDLKNWQWEKEQRKTLSKEERIAAGPLRDETFCKTLILNDSTTEALARAFNNNPRGIMWTRDELLGMILSFDKYTGQQGETKTLVNSSHDYVDWKVNRVGSPVLYVHRPCLSIFGTVQTELLKKAFSKEDAYSGFLARLCFTKVDRDVPARWQDSFISDRTTQALAELYHRCLEYQFSDGQPVIIEISPAGREVYIDWHDKLAVAPWVSYIPKKFQSVLEKLKMKGLRIALILHCMDMINERKSEQALVDSSVIEKAVSIGEFFKAHSEYVYETIFEQLQIELMDPLAERVLAAILSLENKIKKGKLPTGLITDFLNVQGDERFKVDPRSVGRMAGELELKTTRIAGGARAFGITPEDLERLKRLSKISDDSDVCDISFKGKKTGKEDVSQIFAIENHVTNVTNVTQDESVPIVTTIPSVPSVRHVKSDELEAHVRSNKINKLFLDSETTGLDPHSDQLVLIQVMAGEQVFFLDPDQDLSSLLSDEKILKVFHNAKFDLQFLKSDCNNIFDTGVAERLLTAGVTPLRELSLQNLAKKYLDIELDKALQTSFSAGKELTPEQVEYAARDVQVLEGIFNRQKENLKNQGLVNTALLEFSIVPATAQIELNGMLVDLDKLDILKDKLSLKITRLEEELGNQVKDLQLSNQNELFGNGINFRSPDQVKKVLQALGFDVKSTAIKELKKIDHPFARALVKHRKASKLLSSFVEALPKHINPKTKRIHPDFHQLGTDTGRYTCSKPNLQQIPKEQEWRDLFVAPPGCKLITADYSQIELRILAELSQDPVFVEAYRSGKDLHQTTANQIGISRDAAKAINFGLCYGMSSKGLAERLNISGKEAQEFIALYFKAYPQVKHTLDQLGLKAVAQGYSETPLGRKRYFKPADSFGAQKSLERKGRNTPIQATCGDILKTAVKNLMPYPHIKVINLVHDEIVLEVKHKDASLETVQTIREAMIRAGEEFIHSIPVEVNITVDTVWRKE